MGARGMVISEFDKKRLAKCIDHFQARGDERECPYVDKLATEVANATVIADSKEMPHDVITMNSISQLRDLDTGHERVYNLSFPADSDAAVGRISVFSPIGAAIFGCQVGDVVELMLPKGACRMQIERIIYQPEAAGHWEL